MANGTVLLPRTRQRTANANCNEGSNGYSKLLTMVCKRESYGRPRKPQRCANDASRDTALKDQLSKDFADNTTLSNIVHSEFSVPAFQAKRFRNARREELQLIMDPRLNDRTFGRCSCIKVPRWWLTSSDLGGITASEESFLSSRFC
jgi:hypothetical protein